jgi:hypothetical protein
MDHQIFFRKYKGGALCVIYAYAEALEETREQLERQRFEIVLIRETPSGRREIPGIPG